MNKIIITRMDGQILTALMNGKRAAQLNLEEEETSILGNIYVGKVKNIAKNISSAFVDLGGGQMAYYSLTENKRHLFTNQDSSCRPLRPGDDIVVQVSKDAIKTKDPVVTGCISFTGRYCVLTTGRPRLGFSSKITDGSWKTQARQILSEEKDEELGIIVRTNAQSVPVEELLKELGQLKDQYYKLMAQVAYRTSGTLLYEAPPSYICSLRDTYREAMEEIVTDEEDIFCRIQEYLKIHQPQDLFRARFYQDPLLSLKNLYSLDKAMEDALAKRVWLRSGGYLVIEPTEAMTVIDVNSGKYAGKKTLQETIRKINLEAAVEIALQLRLRNLSGIILIDFIDMECQEHQKELMDLLASCCAKDPVQTTVVDMTRLGLVEVTRKKIRKPLREQIQKGDKTK